MLTKDLLRTSKRGGNISPLLIDPLEPAALNTAQALIAIFAKSSGQTQKAIEESCQEISHRDLNFKKGLLKLLFDRSEWEELDPEIAKKRHDWLLLADSLRQETIFESYSHFRDIISEHAKAPFLTIYDTIYSDLSEYSRFKSFENIAAVDLLHRYNAALVQSLLLYSRELKITLFSLNLVQKRALFRQLKFHKLLVDCEDKNAELIINLSGPLKLFDANQTYGIRIANFFPHVLNLPKFKIIAQVELTKGKIYKLSLDESCGIKSHYKEATGYVPEEFSELISAFSFENKDWEIEVSGDFVKLGKESYSFADLRCVKKDHSPIYVELFHRWHSSQLLDRLNALEKNPRPDLVLGCDQKIAKAGELKTRLEKSPIFQKQGFFFRDFPTPRQLARSLEM